MQQQCGPGYRSGFFSGSENEELLNTPKGYGMITHSPPSLQSLLLYDYIQQMVKQVLTRLLPEVVVAEIHGLQQKGIHKFFVPLLIYTVKIQSINFKKIQQELECIPPPTRAHMAQWSSIMEVIYCGLYFVWHWNKDGMFTLLHCSSSDSHNSKQGIFIGI